VSKLKRISFYTYAKYPTAELALSGICYTVAGILLGMSAYLFGPLFFAGIFFDIRVLRDFDRQLKFTKESVNDAQTKLGHTMIDVTLAQARLKEAIKEIQKTEKELADTQKRAFSFISDTSFHSIEDRLKKVEKEIGTSFGYSSSTIKNRIEKLEKEIESMRRELRR